MPNPIPVDYVKIKTQTLGAGPITLANPVAGFRGKEALTNGASYDYSIQQPNNQYEVGTGVFSTNNSKFERVPKWSSNANAAIVLTGNAVVTFTLLGEHLAQIATLNFRGEWNVGTAYTNSDVVSYQGSSYIALAPSTGILPTNDNYWGLLAAGGGWRPLLLSDYMRDDGIDDPAGFDLALAAWNDPQFPQTMIIPSGRFRADGKVWTSNKADMGLIGLGPTSQLRGVGVDIGNSRWTVKDFQLLGTTQDPDPINEVADAFGIKISNGQQSFISGIFGTRKHKGLVQTELSGGQHEVVAVVFRECNYCLYGHKFNMNMTTCDFNQSYRDVAVIEQTGQGHINNTNITGPKGIENVCLRIGGRPTDAVSNMYINDTTISGGNDIGRQVPLLAAADSGLAAGGSASGLARFTIAVPVGIASIEDAGNRFIVNYNYSPLVARGGFSIDECTAGDSLDELLVDDDLDLLTGPVVALDSNTRNWVALIVADVNQGTATHGYKAEAVRRNVMLRPLEDGDIGHWRKLSFEFTPGSGNPDPIFDVPNYVVVNLEDELHSSVTPGGAVWVKGTAPDYNDKHPVYYVSEDRLSYGTIFNFKGSSTAGTVVPYYALNGGIIGWKALGTVYNYLTLGDFELLEMDNDLTWVNTDLPYLGPETLPTAKFANESMGILVEAEGKASTSAQIYTKNGNFNFSRVGAGSTIDIGTKIKTQFIIDPNAFPPLRSNKIRIDGTMVGKNAFDADRPIPIGGALEGWVISGLFDDTGNTQPGGEGGGWRAPCKSAGRENFHVKAYNQVIVYDDHVVMEAEGNRYTIDANGISPSQLLDARISIDGGATFAVLYDNTIDDVGWTRWSAIDAAANIAAINAIMATGRGKWLPDGIYKINDTVVQNPNGTHVEGESVGALFTLKINGKLQNTDGVIFMGVGVPARKFTFPFIEGGDVSGGKVFNPSARPFDADLDPVGGLPRDAWYKLLDLTNRNANESSGQGATPKEVTAWYYIGPGTNCHIKSFRVMQPIDGLPTMRGFYQPVDPITRLPIHSSVVQGNTVIWDDVGDSLGDPGATFGIIVDNHYGLEAETVQICGYFPYGKGVLETKCGANETAGGAMLGGEYNHWSKNCVIFSGHASRGAGLFGTVAATSTTIDVLWTDNHPFNTTYTKNKFRGASDIDSSVVFTYTGQNRVVVSGQVRLRFTGVTPNPLTSGMDLEGAWICPAIQGRGSTGTSIENSQVGALNHISRKRSTELEGVGYEDIGPSAAIEWSGRAMQTHTLSNVKIQMHDDVALFLGDIGSVEGDRNASVEVDTAEGGYGYGGRVIASPLFEDDDDSVVQVLFASRFFWLSRINTAFVDLRPAIIKFPGFREQERFHATAAEFVATGSGTNLTVSAITDGIITPPCFISGVGVPANTQIVSQTSGTAGSTGVYVTSKATTASAAAITARGEIGMFGTTSPRFIQYIDVDGVMGANYKRIGLNNRHGFPMLSYDDLTGDIEAYRADDLDDPTAYEILMRYLRTTDRWQIFKALILSDGIVPDDDGVGGIGFGEGLFSSVNAEQYNLSGGLFIKTRSSTPEGSVFAPVGAVMANQNTGVWYRKASNGNSCLGTGSGTSLTVSSKLGDGIAVGMLATGSGVPSNTTIVSQSSGTSGSNGVYVTSNPTTCNGNRLVISLNTGWITPPW